jgi:LacI family transcriptional regulator
LQNSPLTVNRLTVNRLTTIRSLWEEVPKMGKSTVSIKDVAAKVGVSTATVSNVFSGKKPVKDELAAKVRKAASELGYQVNRAASMLRSGENKIVAVVVPDLADPFFTSVIRQIESLAKQDGFEIILANSDNSVENESSRLDALLSWQPAGLIMIPCTDVLPKQLHTDVDGMAVVLADRVADKDLADSITIDNADAGNIAAKYLCELGHRNILLVASDCGIEPIRERSRGAEEAVADFSGSTFTIEAGSSPEIGAERLGKWMDRNAHPTAMIALNDMTTLAVLSCLAERKIEVGTGISVVGFDDYPWMIARRTPLTAVQQPVPQIALSIWQRLRARMNGDKSPPQAIELECSLKVRESAKPISANTGNNTTQSEFDESLTVSIVPSARGKPIH